MEIMLLGVVILGTVIYTFVIIFSYSQESTHLATATKEVQQRLTQARQRLAEKTATAEQLEAELPSHQHKVAHLKQWVDRLKRQRASLNPAKTSKRVTIPQE